MVDTTFSVTASSVLDATERAGVAVQNILDAAASEPAPVEASASSVAPAGESSFAGVLSAPIPAGPPPVTAGSSLLADKLISDLASLGLSSASALPTGASTIAFSVIAEYQKGIMGALLDESV